MGNKNTKLNDQQATTPNTISSSQSLNKISGPTPNGAGSAQRMKHSTTFTNTSSNTLNRPSQNKNPSTTNSTSNTTTTTIVANLVASPLTFRQKNFQHYQKKPADVVNLNQAMRAKQNDLTNIIKQIDSNHASYQHASGSKLYKPSSFLNNTHANTRAHANHERTQTNGNKKQASLSSSSSSKSSSMTSGSPMQNGHKQNGHAQSTANINGGCMNKSPQSPHGKHVKISPEAVRSSKTNSVSSLNTTANSNTTTTTKNGGVKNSTTSKLTKKFGLSPRFKRKIVETIKNGVQSSLNHSSSCDQANQKFHQVCDYS